MGSLWPWRGGGDTSGTVGMELEVDQEKEVKWPNKHCLGQAWCGQPKISNPRIKIDIAHLLYTRSCQLNCGSFRKIFLFWSLSEDLNTERLFRLRTWTQKDCPETLPHKSQ